MKSIVTILTGKARIFSNSKSPMFMIINVHIVHQVFFPFTIISSIVWLVRKHYIFPQEKDLLMP